MRIEKNEVKMRVIPAGQANVTATVRKLIIER